MLLQAVKAQSRPLSRRHARTTWTAAHSNPQRLSFVVGPSAGTASIPVARHRVAAACRQWHVSPSQTEAAELVTAELVTNAVIHAECPDGGSAVLVECWLDEDHRLHLTVADGDPHIPPATTSQRRRSPSAGGELPESGWGLSIVDTLAMVDVREEPCGKTVHAMLR